MSSTWDGDSPAGTDGGVRAQNGPNRASGFAWVCKVIHADSLGGVGEQRPGGARAASGRGEASAQREKGVSGSRMGRSGSAVRSGVGQDQGGLKWVSLRISGVKNGTFRNSCRNRKLSSAQNGATEISAKYRASPGARSGSWSLLGARWLMSDSESSDSGSDACIRPGMVPGGEGHAVI